jgi:GNAT superfamily N-acetyltransferase
MYIREATPDDNDQLQTLQARCLYGTGLVVSTVNTPDFFARARAYASGKVYAACEDDQIIGSAACALRNGVVSGAVSLVGYVFQAFTSPKRRRQGIADQLCQHIEGYLTQNGAKLAYGLIVEGNLPSMRMVEQRGFALHRALVMPMMLVYQEMEVPPRGTVRLAAPEELPAVARLLNETWQGFELYEPASADGLAQFISRTPEFGLDNLLVLERQGEIAACLGFWDWSRITRITVKALNPRLRMMGLLLDIVGALRPMPRIAKPGQTLKQWCLTPVGFKDVADLAVLFRYVNNQALARGIEQIFSVCERDHQLLNSIKGFFRADVLVHLYVKPLQPNVALSDQPVFVDGIDL